MVQRLDKLMDDVSHDSLCHRVAGQQVMLAVGHPFDPDEVTRSRIVARDAGRETDAGLDLLRSAVGRIAGVALRSDLPLYLLSEWFDWHRLGAELGSRLGYLISGIPPSVIDGWENSGILTDNYSVPADDLTAARSSADFRRFRDRLGPSLRRQFDSRAGMLNEPECMMLIGTDRDGNCVCRSYSEPALLAS